MHTCISLERVPSPLKRKEAHSSLDQLFDEAEILFNNNIEMLLLPQFTRFWNGSFGFQFVVGFGKCSTMLLLNEQHPCCSEQKEECCCSKNQPVTHSRLPRSSGAIDNHTAQKWS